MRWFSRYWCVLVIPAAWGVLEAWQDAATSPYWLYFDPSYSYLLNSLNLLKGMTPLDIFHPGTSLQELCLCVVRILNIGRPVPDIVHRVLIDPEFYLGMVHSAMAFMVVVSLALLGWYVHQATKDKVLACLSQLPSVVMLPYFLYVTPDPFLILLMNVFFLCFFALFFDGNRRKDWCWVILWGVVCGCGLVAKFIFLPLVVVPLIVLRWPLRGVFLAACVVASVVFTWPIMPEYHRLWLKAMNLVTHTGIHGQGAVGFIDIPRYLEIWRNICAWHPWIITGLVAAIGVCAWSLFRKGFGRREVFLAAAIAGVLAQFGIVARYYLYVDHYLVPGLALGALLWVLVYARQGAASVLGRGAVLVMFILLVGQSLSQAFTARVAALDFRKDVFAFNDMLQKKYPACAVVGAYAAYRMPYAFLWSNRSSLAVSRELEALYPGHYYMDEFSRDVRDFEGRVYTNDLAARKGCVLFVASTPTYCSDGPYTLKALEDSKFQHAYLLEQTAERQVDALFEAAVKAYEQGDIAKAVALALKSREFNYQPRGKVDYFLMMAYGRLKH